MTFSLYQSSNPLPAPGQLFQKQAASLPLSSNLGAVSAQIQQTPAAPALKPDTTRFSLVSRLLSPFENISLAPLKAVPGQIMNGLEKGWQALKDTFTFQFEEAGRFGTEREAESNCGPASASMILKQLGVYPPTMQQMRLMVGAPIGSGSRPFALSTEQVITAVKKSASQKGRYISTETRILTRNVDVAISEMRNRLARGEKLILLTSGFRSLSQGHYVVVKEVRADGSLLVDDPGRSDGENIVYSKSRLAKVLQVRQETYGMQNCLLAFKT
ncbi:hypothetical protein COW36_05810 [bacterium (Candidatus Blackallbacteria) CG17_big_fil_post_rev_8_21_14_2_50_48_46]|uniref:Peptidase C39-like domain-containing protein n=1 Tax=bacterium (Candidatus Blackallbacteria) CG17_big_fil_post_rev_8_21_14_2_50_48_46 TaxID=2014261 RepID=A0A2M7G873_9BACT|nr:MAG: hypothetical protein COW64_21405 [bacterium (Candidatus Blackallbacteria) CG18_big_fil_WC_8_21_14_2_50_49_26]PIW18283.1 MAG: hypothetical protein COW36_05810 [bacterium (Candidatus Blackallbacteria) CG17_big_fil_post_rev_8_21_14_2_50_48_46]PIW49507.1 MAG: hypothetical protein COW20_05625 [bacterium (Candidatus Blackallbacteria) CG13_big_fil_rev_8_21_14_2_50_49_14]